MAGARGGVPAGRQGRGLCATGSRFAFRGRTEACAGPKSPVLRISGLLQPPCPPRRRRHGQRALARFGGRGSVLRAGLDPRLRGGRGPRGPLPSGPCDIHGVSLGIVLKIPVVGFAGIEAVAPRWAYRDSRDEPENDTVGGAGFRKVIAGRRLGPVFVRAPPVPITERAVEEHPERCAGALHEAHENAQHRLQRKLDQRWVAWAVCAVSCSFHAGHYKSANTPPIWRHGFLQTFRLSYCIDWVKTFCFPQVPTTAFPRKLHSFRLYGPVRTANVSRETSGAPRRGGRAPLNDRPDPQTTGQ